MQNPSVRINEEGQYDCTPTFLFDYPELYRSNPVEATRTWFRDARYGLGISFGIHGLLGKGDRVMQDLAITIPHYENLKDSFKADRFDAMELVHFAIANGMRYIEFSVCGPDGFALWNRSGDDFNSVHSPAHRDLLGELASVCEYEGVGLTLRYSQGERWRRDNLESEEYFHQVCQEIKELLTQYGPIAAIHLDGRQNALPRAEAMQVDSLYSLIHNLQAQTLISYEQGITGNEDILSWKGEFPTESASDMEKGFLLSENGKLRQCCASLTPGYWGYHVESAGKHLKEAEVHALLLQASGHRANLLLNTNLMPDGSLDLEDMNTLLAVGKEIQHHGFPRT